MIPLAGNNFELKQHPQTFAWYVKDLEGNMKPKYISKLELRSNAIARVAPLTPPALPPAEEGAGKRHGGVIFWLSTCIFFGQQFPSQVCLSIVLVHECLFDCF